MMLLRLAWRNLGRNKRRTALTAAAGVFATLLSMLNLAVADGSHERWIEHAVRLYPGHLQVSLAGYREYRTLDYALPLDADAERKLDALSDGSSWAPRLEAWGLISADTDSATGRGVQLFGIDAAREARLSKLVSAIDRGRMAARADGSREIALGALLARNLGVTLGDAVIVLSADAFGSQSADRFTVVGTFAVGDDELMSGALSTSTSCARSWAAAPARVAVFLPESATWPSVAAGSTPTFPAGVRGAALAGADPGPRCSSCARRRGNWIGNSVLIVVVGFGSEHDPDVEFERVREFGVLRALGLRPRAVFTLVLIESVQLTLVGIAIGFAIGIPLVLWLAQHPIPITGEGVRGRSSCSTLSPDRVRARPRSARDAAAAADRRGVAAPSRRRFAQARSTRRRAAGDLTMTRCRDRLAEPAARLAAQRGRAGRDHGQALGVSSARGLEPGLLRQMVDNAVSTRLGHLAVLAQRLPEEPRRAA
jgi:hypothetical protein